MSLKKETKSYEDFVRTFVQEEEKKQKASYFESSYLLCIISAFLGFSILSFANNSMVSSTAISPVLYVVGSAFLFSCLALFWKIYGHALKDPLPYDPQVTESML